MAGDAVQQDILLKLILIISGDEDGDEDGDGDGDEFVDEDGDGDDDVNDKGHIDTSTQ